MDCDAGFLEGIYFEEKIDERTRRLLGIWKGLCHKKIDEAEKGYRFNWTLGIIIISYI